MSALAALIDDADVQDLQRLQAEGTLTARSLTEYYLAQIKATRDTINAVIMTNPDALIIADELDAARQRGEPRGLLHGIPILIKDNIETREMPTTAGSLYLADNHTGRDAPLVARLRHAGAIILGKSNLSEWANFRSSRPSSGWSGVGGQTRNPHDLTRSPGGSSSGSGAGVAANLSAAAVGTETSGSIICPASVNGIVGLKPTVGLVSRQHIIPISHTQDTAGPMTRSVRDAALMLRVMAGHDAAEDATDLVASGTDFDFHSGLEKTELKGVGLSVLSPPAKEIHYDTLALFEEARGALAGAGATLIDANWSDEPYPEYHKDTFTIMLYEFKQGLDTYFGSLTGSSSGLSLEGLIAFNQENAAREMPHFGQEVLERTLACGSLDDSRYTSALARARTYARTSIDQLLEAHDTDFYVSVSMDHSWPIDHIGGDRGAWSNSNMAAVSGYPHITVPMGCVKGLPVGLSFIGRPLSEARLLAAAQAFESRQKDFHS